MTGHTMRVMLEYDMVRLTPECHEPDGAECRVACAQNICESYTYPEHEHGLRNMPYCNAVEDLTAHDAVDQRCGSDSPVPLYDGMPITVSWEGDYYSWSPADRDTPEREA